MSLCPDAEGLRPKCDSEPRSLLPPYVSEFTHLLTSLLPYVPISISWLNILDSYYHSWFAGRLVAVSFEYVCVCVSYVCM